MGKSSAKRRFKIYQEDVKLRHTSHWDADYMSREEFEAYMSGKTVCQVKRNAGSPAAEAKREGDTAPRPHLWGMSLWERFLRACLPDR